MIPELYNMSPSLIYQESLKAINNRKCLLVFCDKGMAVNIMIRFVCQTML